MQSGGVRRTSFALMRSLEEIGGCVEVDARIKSNPLDAAAPRHSKLLTARMVAADTRREILGDPSARVVHSLYFDHAMLASKRPVALTVYDMIHERFGFGSWILPAMKRVLVGRADVVIAISQTTANDAQQYFPGVKKVEVIPLAVPDEFVNTPRDPAANRQFVLHVGQRRRHKNFSILLDAYRISPALRALPLVCVGGSEMTPEEQGAIVLATGRPADHRMRVSDAELMRLYDNALVAVVPSLWEGFGLPVIEAMVRRTPVACSDAGSLAEAADGHAALFDPVSAEDCAAAILRSTTLNDEALESAQAYASMFTWRRYAAAHMALYSAME